MRMTDDQAFDAFRSIRWADTNGNAVCGKCGCFECYTFKARRIFKCRACGAQFSVTSGTIFASRKTPLRDILAAIAIFVNGAKGRSALQLSRDLDVQYKTAFVLSHKIREALAAEQRASTIEGEVEIDGAYFGGYVKPANRRADHKDRRRKVHQSGKRQVVVVARERDGETLTPVALTEAAGVPFVLATIALGDCVAPKSAYITISPAHI
jgi:transposase-like protein